MFLRWFLTTWVHTIEFECRFCWHFNFSLKRFCWSLNLRHCALSTGKESAEKQLPNLASLKSLLANFQMWSFYENICFSSGMYSRCCEQDHRACRSLVSFQMYHFCKNIWSWGFFHIFSRPENTTLIIRNGQEPGSDPNPSLPPSLGNLLKLLHCI